MESIKLNNQKSKVAYTDLKQYKVHGNKNVMLRFNKDLIDDLYIKNKEILEANIYVHRIIANIVLMIKDDQFFVDNGDYQYKLNLFDDEFLTRDNTGATFHMNSYDICKGGNYDRLEDALLWLSNYLYGWYTSVNEKGEKVKNLGGFIINPSYNQKSGNFKFFVMSYWLKRLVNVDKYNATYYYLVQNLSSNKHIIFWHWLSRIPVNGTQIKYTTLNEMFDLNYDNARDLCKGFLRVIKKKFDLYSPESFNYKYSKGMIYIVRYARSAEEFSMHNNVSDATKKQLSKKYKLNYFVWRHDLSSYHKGRIEAGMKSKRIELIEGYKYFVKECRKKKINADSIKGDDFMKAYNDACKQHYLTTPTGKMLPNAYPSF